MTGSHRTNNPKRKGQQLDGDESTSCGDVGMKDIELAPLVPASPLGEGSFRHCLKKQPKANRLDKGISVLSNDSNGKILSAYDMYSFCSVSMVLTNKSLASRFVIFLRACLMVLSFGTTNNIACAVTIISSTVI